MSAVRTVASEEDLSCPAVETWTKASKHLLKCMPQGQENAGDTANRQPDGNAAMDLEEAASEPPPDRHVLVYLPDAKGLLGKFEPACVLGMQAARHCWVTLCSRQHLSRRRRSRHCSLQEERPEGLAGAPEAEVVVGGGAAEKGANRRRQGCRGGRPPRRRRRGGRSRQCVQRNCTHESLTCSLLPSI